MKAIVFLVTVTTTLALAGPGTTLPAKPVKSASAKSGRVSTTRPSIAPDPDNGGLKLASGFQALVFADNLGKARHAAIDPTTGTLFVKLDRLKDGKGIVQLSDTDGDGRADQTVTFGTYPGTGAGIYNGYLYASADTAVFRYKLTNGKVMETTQPETIVTGLTLQRQHAGKSLALSPDGKLYVNFGAPSNACQEKDRTQGSKGQDPCPILENYGGIWIFDANKPNQKQSDGKRYATGIRNAVALDWNTANNTLYALQHGRDMLATLYPSLYTNEQSAELPNEELLMVKEGNDFGWPYCYNDDSQGKKVLAPEYGGDGKTQDRCAGKEKPIMAFPGHWAPNDLLFYTGSQFPARYKNGAFICFHGSWNRAPLKQGGYFVAFIPFGKDGRPSGKYEVFAENFAGVAEPAKPGDTANAGKPDLASPGDAKARPMGLAQGPDGSLYITDSVKGKVWRVMYAKK
ncbi:PQQ-dependent sugar dehydrogenase [Spirosoma utsteinense]|uniref:Glucose/arabinose dehydrogenase n=1 Tax=Spirosoma utsteinense TaxID=2585773 RepID=A0ABR6WAF6_9BACT|nr:PQQ-dependent sugar dehydrogenase [Spirosoma utsteinense]MBC3783869.1 glucose/arabinose dehydrogenase [Spirosoma utsteinense]MBC3793552.1 glucose/arabinose dehydrogenase [Spirosoma utsteinense]